MTREILLCICLCACGCAAEREDLPRFNWTDDQTALRILSQRAKSVRTVSAAALLTLTRPDGQSVRLDAAIAMSLPDNSVRLQAWKFNQKVFDLTLASNGLWVESPKDEAGPQRTLSASLSAAPLARALSLFGGDLFEGPGVQVIDHGGGQFLIRKRLDQGQTIDAYVDRALLVVRRYRLIDESGVARFTLTARHYHDLHGLVWPTKLTAQSDYGQVDLELRDVELNGQIPAAAFVPPPGARRTSRSAAYPADG